MSNQTPADTLSNSTEAPLSSNFYWTFGKAEVFNIQTTVRDGVTPEALERHLFMLKEAMLKVLDMGGHAKPVGQQPVQPPMKDNPAAKIAREEGNETLASQLETEDGMTDYDATVQFTRLVITPQPDERVNLEFFAEGHKFPDVKVNKWKVAQAEGLLKHFGNGIACDKPADLPLKGIVYYKHGSEYQPGKRYKDVTHARPI